MSTSLLPGGHNQEGCCPFIANLVNTAAQDPPEPHMTTRDLVSKKHVYNNYKRKGQPRQSTRSGAPGCSCLLPALQVTPVTSLATVTATIVSVCLCLSCSCGLVSSLLRLYGLGLSLLAILKFPYWHDSQHSHKTFNCFWTWVPRALGFVKECPLEMIYFILLLPRWWRPCEHLVGSPSYTLLFFFFKNLYNYLFILWFQRNWPSSTSDVTFPQGSNRLKKMTPTFSIFFLLLFKRLQNVAKICSSTSYTNT